MTEAKQIRDTLDDMKARILTYDAKMNDPHGDGTGSDARSPNGDDYNELYSELIVTLATVETIPLPELGRLWWIADTPHELAQLLTEYTGKGATVVNIDAKRDAPRIHYIMELDKVCAPEILGYTPDDDEWLIEADLQQQAAEKV